MGVSVRHNAAVAAVVALVSAVVTVAWFARSLQTGSVVDWAVTLVLAAVAVLQLLVVRDARAPLMVADEQGVRVRRGRTWTGLRWQDVDQVEVRSPGSWLRDGSIVVHPLGETDGEPADSFRVPLGLTTKVDHEGLTGDLVTDLDSLASGQVPVVVLTGVAPAAGAQHLRSVPRPEDDRADEDRSVADRTDDDRAAEERPEDEPRRDGADLPEAAAARKVFSFPRPRVAPAPAAQSADERDDQPAHDPAHATVDEPNAGVSEVPGTTDPADEVAVDLPDAPAAEEESAPRRGAALLRRFAARSIERVTARVPEEREDAPEAAGSDEALDVPEAAEVPETPESPETLVTAGESDADPSTAEPAAEEEQDDAVEPDRPVRVAARSEVVRESVRVLPTPPIPEQRSVRDGDEPVRVGRPGLRPDRHDRHDGPEGSDGSGDPALPGAAPVLVGSLDDLGSTTAPENPVIGPRVAAARHRARLSIDTLSDRTRIRPHVLERIEVDDFAACGGDFYARGHLRTLARIFGLDADELVALYDQHYASAEIEARQVFEAELASGIGGGVRAAHSGPRWSLLAACVVVLAGVWGASRVFDDTPQELVSPAPGVVDSAGLASTEKQPTVALAPVEVTASGASPQVVVRDRSGKILWAGRLADGQRQQVIGLAPFDVTSSNGGAVRVAYLGKGQGTVGDGSAAASKRFGSR